jgi:DNA-binding MarR family transcriptional regulator
MQPPSPTGDSDAAAVFESIHAIMHLYRARQYRETREEAGDLTHLEGKVLGFFARHPGATQSDLIARSGRDKAQLARLVRGLRDKELLQAVVDQEDRRVTRLHVSEAGNAIARGVHESGERLAQVAVAGLPDDERRQLLALLEKVRATLEGGAQA